MDELHTEINQLKDARLDYVNARSIVNSDAQAIKDSKVPKATFYSWSKEERDHLNNIAQRMKRDVVFRMVKMLQDAGEDAVTALLKTMKSKNENVKQKASIEVIDRILGKPSQNVKAEVTGADGKGIVIEVEYVKNTP